MKTLIMINGIVCLILSIVYICIKKKTNKMIDDFVKKRRQTSKQKGGATRPAHKERIYDHEVDAQNFFLTEQALYKRGWEIQGSGHELLQSEMV